MSVEIEVRCPRCGARFRVPGDGPWPVLCAGFPQPNDGYDPLGPAHEKTICVVVSIHGT